MGAVRIKSVTLKANGLKVIPTPGLEARNRAVTLARVRRTLDNHGHDVAGMAFVVWDKDGGSTCDMMITDRSGIPTILIPDFVRNRLLAWRIESWTIESINGT